MSRTRWRGRRQPPGISFPRTSRIRSARSTSIRSRRQTGRRRLASSWSFAKVRSRAVRTPILSVRSEHIARGGFPLKAGAGLAVVAALLAAAPDAQGAEIFEKVGTAGAQFLKIGVGARAVGMGEAFVAVAD